MQLLYKIPAVHQYRIHRAKHGEHPTFIEFHISTYREKALGETRPVESIICMIFNSEDDLKSIKILEDRLGKPDESGEWEASADRKEDTSFYFSADQIPAMWVLGGMGEAPLTYYYWNAKIRVKLYPEDQASARFA